MIVATCASLSSREKQLQRAVESLLPQVDAICVYLNGYQRVPSFLHHHKVLYAVLSSEAGWRGAEAKLWFWDTDEFRATPAPWDPDTVGLLFDDDIIYPGNYVERMTLALRQRPGSFVCVHGSILKSPFVSWRISRRCIRFIDSMSEDRRVHVPGTGTLGFVFRDFPISLKRDIRWSHADDPSVAAFLNRRGAQIWALARPTRWLRNQNPAGSSINRQRILAGVDVRETEIIFNAGPWPELEVPGWLEGERLKKTGLYL